MRLFPWLAAAGLCLLGAVPAAAQDDSGIDRELLETADALGIDRATLEQVDLGLVEKGYDTLEEPFFGSLDDGASIDIEIEMARGVELVFAGFCDGNCGDVDLALIDPNGTEIASDVLADAIPIVTVTPPADGIYLLRVTMASCALDRCSYMVQMYW